MTSEFPPGSHVNKEFELPKGGILVLNDKDGNFIDNWELNPIVDDWGNVIPGAKYKIAASPTTINKPEDTHR